MVSFSNTAVPCTAFLPVDKIRQYQLVDKGDSFLILVEYCTTPSKSLWERLFRGNKAIENNEAKTESLVIGEFSSKEFALSAYRQLNLALAKNSRGKVYWVVSGGILIVLYWLLAPSPEMMQAIQQNQLSNLGVVGSHDYEKSLSNKQAASEPLEVPQEVLELVEKSSK